MGGGERPPSLGDPRGRTLGTWSVDDAPPGYLQGQLRAIVGVELLISRIEAKFKLSQHRAAAHVEGDLAGLEARDETWMAAATRQPRRGAR